MNRNTAILLLALFLLVLAVGIFYFKNSLDSPFYRGEQKEALPVAEKPQADQVAEVKKEATAAAYDEADALKVRLKSEFSQKYNKKPDQIEVAVSEVSGMHAKGLVNFSDELRGGWWLAVQDNQGWQLVADGNGTVYCRDIEPFYFSAEMVPECYDQTKLEVVQR